MKDWWTPETLIWCILRLSSHVACQICECSPDISSFEVSAFLSIIGGKAECLLVLDSHIGRCFLPLRYRLLRLNIRALWWKLQGEKETCQTLPPSMSHVISSNVQDNLNCFSWLLRFSNCLNAFNPWTGTDHSVNRSQQEKVTYILKWDLSELGLLTRRGSSGTLCEVTMDLWWPCITTLFLRLTCWGEIFFLLHLIKA